MEKTFNSNKAPEPVGSYPHAKQVGNLLFLSGVGPRERGTKIIPGVELDSNGEIVTYDIAKQCQKEGYNNLRQSGLKKAMDGMTSLEEINRVTSA